MHIAVLGAGALGSILAAHLARAGQDVSLLARGERARLLTEGGITITGLSEMTTPVRVLTDPSQLRDADLLILAVKAYDTASALAGVSSAKVKTAFSVQNGLEKDIQLANAFGPGVIGATSDFSGEVLPDGTVHFTRNEGLYLGELPSGLSPRIHDVATMLTNAGIDTRPREDMLAVEWSKLVAWVGMTTPALLTRLETHRLFQDSDLGRLQVTLLAECHHLTSALNIFLVDLSPLVAAKTLTTLPEADAIAHLRRHGQSMQAAGNLDHKMSALQDLERGRRLELEETYGYLLRRAHELNIEMPVLEACYHTVKAIERSGATS